ncbi:MAG: hypothetical protein AAGA65_31685 [Actinomycetota bacterium]
MHLANGVRHLVWDAGLGLEKKIANKSGLWVIAFAVLATAATWAIAWRPSPTGSTRRRWESATKGWSPASASSP